MAVAITSKETILAVCRNIISQKGLHKINMRTVAKQCGVALGSLYNYYSCKEELVLDSIQSVWHDIFKSLPQYSKGLPFDGYVNALFYTILNGTQQYPNFFTSHSLSFTQNSKNKARETMDFYLQSIQAQMLEALNNDERLNPLAFNSRFTKEGFISFILQNIINLILQNKSDCTTLIKIISKIIY